MNFIIDLHPYGFDLMVSIEESEDSFVENLRKSGIEDEEDDYYRWEREGHKGRTFQFYNGQLAIRLKHSPLDKPGYLAHEVLHVVHYLFDRIGIPMKNSSIEAWTYLVQYITDEVYNKVREQNSVH